MSKKRSFIIISTAVIAIVILIAGLFVLQKFMNHEANQSDRLDALEGRIGLIEEKDKLAEGSTEEILWGGGTTI